MTLLGIKSRVDVIQVICLTRNSLREDYEILIIMAPFIYFTLIEVMDSNLKATTLYNYS